MSDQQTHIPRATLGRLPLYLAYLQTLPSDQKHISAAKIAKDLGRGEVQVRKDLHVVSGIGKPRVGYVKKDLINEITRTLGINNRSSAVLVGAGKLGRALLEYSGFAAYGMQIRAAFDTDDRKIGQRYGGIACYSLDQLRHFCQMHSVDVGIITVPRDAAQGVCDQLVKSGVAAIWNFSPIALKTPPSIEVKNENLALSLAQLTRSVRQKERVRASG